MATEDGRQTGPFDKLLESYLLWMIDELPASQAKALQDMTPKIAEALGHRSSSWQEIVKAEVGFTDDDVEELRSMWRRTLDKNSEMRHLVDPHVWVERVIATNN